MEIKFSICPHDTAKGLEKWKIFVEKLEKKLGLNVDFQPFSSFAEEDIRLNQEFFHIYYSSPSKQVELLERGYFPVAKFKGQVDSLFLITKSGIPEEGEIKVALPILKPAGYGILGLDINRVRLIFTKDFVEVFQLVKEGKVDVGVMYNETWDQIENREDVKIIEDSKLDTHHIFMVHNSIYDKVKPVLLSFDEVEEATLDDVQKARNLIEKFEKFSIIWKDESIVRSIKDSPFIGVMIYRDKILYINDFVSKISGFSKEELIGMSIFDLVDRVKDENIKQTIKENIQKRLEGKHGIYTYVDLPFLTKNEEIVYLYIYSDTILYFGEYAGIVFVIDDTKRKKLENINNLLKEVNDAIIHSTFEEELFEKIADALVNKIGLKLVWIGKEKPDTKEIIPTFYKGEAIDYLKEIKISSREDIPEGQGITGRAYREYLYGFALGFSLLRGVNASLRI